MVEGPTLVRDAFGAGWAVECQFVAPDAEPVDAHERVAGAIHFLAPGVAERVSDVQSGTGLLAIVSVRPPSPGLLDGADFVVVADRVADPGNLGTIWRSGEAAGADVVVVTPGSVDVMNPKVVRASAGACFHVPAVTASLPEVRAAGLDLIGTSSHRGSSHVATDWRGRIAIVVGNEAVGLDDDAPVDRWVRIEHVGRGESLNVSMAATVLCFEAARQRAGEPASSRPTD